MKMLKFLITRHVFFPLLILLLTAFQLIKCTNSSYINSHKKGNITLTAKNDIKYTCDPEPPAGLRLGKGSFGVAVIGKRIDENGIKTKVAMKIEKRTHNTMLDNEERMYKILNGQVGIPTFFDYFKNHNGKAILVIELLGKSLSALLKSKTKFSIKTSMMIGLEILDIVEAIHEKGLIYSDIKPDNFAVGREDKSKIYILDFGLTTFYIKDGKHVEPARGHGAGTTKYMSLYAHTHFVLSRRDDIESIVYLLIEFLNGRIWRTNVKEKIIHQKTTWSLKSIAKKTCSETLVEFLKYARELDFYAKPDYGYLRGLLRAELERHQLFDDRHFDWMKSYGETDVHEQSNEMPQMSSIFTATDSPIQAANERPSMHILVATNNNNNHQIQNNPLIVQQSHVQNVHRGQPLMITHSIPVASNVLPTQIQHPLQQIQHLPSVVIV